MLLHLAEVLPIPFKQIHTIMESRWGTTTPIEILHAVEKGLLGTLTLPPFGNDEQVTHADLKFGKDRLSR